MAHEITFGRGPIRTNDNATKTVTAPPHPRHRTWAVHRSGC